MSEYQRVNDYIKSKANLIEGSMLIALSKIHYQDESDFKIYLTKGFINLSRALLVESDIKKILEGKYTLDKETNTIKFN